jgi:oligopeptide transport system substrate-binding protein
VNASRARSLLCLVLAAAVLFATTACDAIPSAIGGDDGGTLRMQGYQPDTLDPALVRDVTSWQYMLQIFSGLVTLNDRLEVVPDAAESVTVSPDGLTYTFRLRDDIKFHDGRLVVADDFRYSIERALDPATRSPTASQYLGDIVGARERANGRAASVAGLRVLDARTLEIEIDAPKRYFLSKLTYPSAFVVDQRQIAGTKDWHVTPNGSGPFRVAEWHRDNALILRRNDHYYRQRPHLTRVEYIFGQVPAMFQYERDDIDLTQVSLAYHERVTDPRSPLSRELVISPMLSVWYLGLNAQQAPFDDVKVRQAFMYATDRSRIARVRFKGTREMANGILPPGIPGFDESLRATPLDLDKARQLLAESRYGGPEGLPEIILSVGLGAGPLAAGFAQMYERNLGVSIAVHEVEDDYYGDLENQRLQMFYVGWVADYPDPENFLDMLFHSDSHGNYSAYSNSRVDSILERARVEQNDQARLALYREAERMILDDSPVIPLLHDVTYYLVKPRVTGLTLTPMGLLSLRDIEVRAVAGTR